MKKLIGKILGSIYILYMEFLVFKYNMSCKIKKNNYEKRNNNNAYRCYMYTYWDLFFRTN